jgi:BirA family biotin operon repressor/biotin-[acetyl-CoA-carboxylase] ligase
MAGEGAVVTTGRQSAGRGRLGRVWIDDEGTGIAMSLAVPMQNPATLSLAAGIAVLEVIRAAVPSTVGSTLGLKFPNDVVESTSGAKIAGILVEASDGIAVIGVGINLHCRRWPPKIHAMAVEELAPETSLCRIDLLEALPSRISEAIDFTPAEIADRFSAVHAPTGCRVEVEIGESSDCWSRSHLWSISKSSTRRGFATECPSNPAASFLGNQKPMTRSPMTGSSRSWGDPT